jgi:hypothetical protein
LQLLAVLLKSNAMAIVTNFNTAKVEGIALAKVGNPQRGETLKMSKELCRFGEEDAAVLTFAFLKPFKNLERYSFHHHANLELNELYGYVDSAFKEKEDFLNQARKTARLLFEKSKHPNIKSGELCMAYIDGIQVDGETCQALSIVKSESQVPFLEISDKSGDLELITHSGIYPDKIDKGALIIDYDKGGGYLVYTFDRAGGETNFWVKDFLGARKRRDSEYKTKQYAEMCNSFVKEGLDEGVKEEERFRIANNTAQYMAGKDKFNATHFEEEALKEPELIEQFKSFKSKYQDDEGNAIDEEFEIEKQVAKKVSGKFKPAIRLDSGVIIRFTPDFVENSDALERGQDPDSGRKFVKVYYEEEL